MRALSLALLAVLSTQAAAEDTLLYELGGARPVGGAISVNWSASIGLDPSFGANWTCGGKFDPLQSVASVLNNVKQGIEDFQSQMVLAAQGAIASLPALLLQRVNPGLYDIFQNATLAAKADVNLSIASCEQMSQAVREGRNPFAEWANFSAHISWNDQIVAGLGNNARQAERNVNERGGRDGIPWLCGGARSGGQGQQPIRPVGDATVAGYNLLLGRVNSPTSSQYCSDAPAPISSNTSPGAIGAVLGDAFGTPNEAREWVTQVVGDQQVYTYDTPAKQEQVGVGVMPMIERDSSNIRNYLAGMVTNNAAISPEQRRQVSSPGMPLSNQVINSLRGMPPPERDAAVSRLADETAMIQNLQKLLMARRMLNASLDVAAVQGTEAATSVRAAIAEIEEQINELNYEADMRERMVSRTALLLLERERQRRADPINTMPEQDTLPLQDGAGRRPGS